MAQRDGAGDKAGNGSGNCAGNVAGDFACDGTCDGADDSADDGEGVAHAMLQGMVQAMAHAIAPPAGDGIDCVTQGDFDHGGNVSRQARPPSLTERSSRAETECFSIIQLVLDRLVPIPRI